MVRVLSERHKQKIGAAVSKVRKGKKLTDAHRKALRGSHMKRERVVCSHCDNLFAINAIKLHEVACSKKQV